MSPTHHNRVKVSFHKRYSDNVARLLRVVLAALLLGSTAQAQIVQRAVPRPKSTTCGAEVAWDWTFTLAVQEAPAAAFDRLNWRLNPTSPAAAAGVTAKDLTIDVQHLVTCETNDGGPVDGGPGPTLSIKAGSYARGTVRGGVNIIQHPNQAGHVDIYNWTAQVPAAGPPAILVKAKHSNVSQLPKWSFTPIAARRGNLKVFASYPTDPEKGPVNTIKGFAPGDTPPKGTLPNSDSGQSPSDVRIVVEYNPISDTTLAFVVTNPDGRLDKGDLSQLMDFFIGADTYLAPALFAEQGPQELFVAVDLSQWLSSPTAYKVNDRFVFENGVSNSLPGFLASTSPIRFDPEIGFVATTPYSGAVTVLGDIDGSVSGASDVSQPAPPSVAKPAVPLLPVVIVLAVLLVIALALLFRRRRS